MTPQPGETDTSHTRIVLLRGINVSGHRKVPMADLRSALGDAGLSNVRTYIQSGNVVIDDAPDDNELRIVFQRVLVDSFGLDDVPIVVRTKASLEHTLARSIELFPDDGGDKHGAFTHAMFMNAKPPPVRRAALDPAEFAPDRFQLDLHDADAELHISYAEGVSGSKLTIDRVERGYGVAATARNVNTIRKLASM